MCVFEAGKIFGFDGESEVMLADRYSVWRLEASKLGDGQLGKQFCRANTKGAGFCGFAFMLNCVPMGVCQVSEVYGLC
jgi:hypothetical protein